VAMRIGRNGFVMAREATYSRESVVRSDRLARSDSAGPWKRVQQPDTLGLE
jgi:hypothetical protein